MREGWEYKKLGDCLSYIKNGANIKQTQGATGIPITRIETLSGGVFNRDRLGYANILSADKYSQNILDDGDILMSHINSKAYIGRSVLYKKEDDEQIIHGMNLLRLKAIPSIILPTFLNTSFQSVSFHDKVARIRKDAVNQSSMAISDLIKIPIPVPPLSEQQRIVSELDLLSSIIEKKKAQLKEYDQLAQSIFYDMFGDPVTNEIGWEVKKLGEVCNVINGFAFPSSDFSIDGSIKVVKITNVGVNEFIRDDSSLPDKYDTMNNFKVHYKDIVIALTRTIISSGLKRALVPFDYDLALVNQRVAAISVNDSVVQTFIYNYLGTQYVKDFVLSHATALMQPNLSINDLKTMPIYFPPLPLQQSFASKIEAIERQKALIQQSIAEVQMLFDSRMDDWFA